jgi:hypothetical protein
MHSLRLKLGRVASEVTTTIRCLSIRQSVCRRLEAAVHSLLHRPCASCKARDVPFNSSTSTGQPHRLWAIPPCSLVHLFHCPGVNPPFASHCPAFAYSARPLLSCLCPRLHFTDANRVSCHTAPRRCVYASHATPFMAVRRCSGAYTSNQTLNTHRHRPPNLAARLSPCQRHSPSRTQRAQPAHASRCHRWRCCQGVW